MNFIVTFTSEKQTYLIAMNWIQGGKSGHQRVIIADNIRPVQTEDKCNRKQVQFGCSETR